MKKQDALKLLKRYRRGLCSEEERYLVERWYEQLHEESPFSLTEEELSRIEAEMWTALNKEKPKRLGRLPAYIQAAAALLLLGLSFAVYRYMYPVEPPVITQVDSLEIHDITAAQDRAVLTLSSGEQVLLDSCPHGLVAKDDGIRVLKDPDGHLFFQAVETRNSNQAGGFHEIRTPKGGHYTIRLADGTDVWLGPASSLKYPTRFAAEERRVSVEGEAYFEVTQQIKHVYPSDEPKRVPFFVETPRQLVQVLGTHFNVNDYINDPISRVTLLEGRVKVRSGSSKARSLLPGEQSAVTRKDQELTVQHVDLAEFAARKAGYFYFNNSDLQEVVTQLERWYAIDAIDKHRLPGNRYSGKLPRNANLSKILEVLEITSGLKFKMESERRLMLVR
ncbi:FecR family protein [Sphingobacterium paludis]|uniref:FecR family protein n=1 Tax=Sphingobacterium paludis TaxID=1476465 RepID=A0A4R7CUW7_9SPHI|nr:FecR family protein [Sphingobacterium paludis]TDS12179.1 FecR family protein [Sphingobacterium paludis]